LIWLFIFFYLIFFFIYFKFNLFLIYINFRNYYFNFFILKKIFLVK
jgi:hypothetical protein